MATSSKGAFGKIRIFCIKSKTILSNKIWFIFLVYRSFVICLIANVNIDIGGFERQEITISWILYDDLSTMMEWPGVADSGLFLESPLYIFNGYRACATSINEDLRTFLPLHFVKNLWMLIGCVLPLYNELSQARLFFFISMDYFDSIYGFYLALCASYSLKLCFINVILLAQASVVRSGHIASSQPGSPIN